MAGYVFGVFHSQLIATVLGCVTNVECIIIFFLQAIDVYTKALKLIPRFKEAHVNMGQAYKDLGNLSAALEHFDKVTCWTGLCFTRL